MDDSFFRPKPSKLGLVCKSFKEFREFVNDFAQSMAFDNISEFFAKMGCYLVSFSNCEYKRMRCRPRLPRRIF